MTLIAPLIWILVAHGASVPLSGTVVGPGGEPVAGAELILVGLPSYASPIVARGTSGEDGRFTLDRPADLVGNHHPQQAPLIWAFKPGFRLANVRFPESLPGPDEPVRIVLEPPGGAKVRVEGPDGLPVAGAVVLPERLQTHQTLIPDEIADKASATTDEEGVAVLEAATQEELAYVDVRTPQFGVQGWYVVNPTDAPVTVALRSVSTWTGRLTADDPAHLKGWKVRAWTRIGVGLPNEAPQTVGYVETVTDADGRFDLAPIAVGPLMLNLTPPEDLPVIPDVPSGLSVREGVEGSGEIPLRPPVVVTGRIVERGTGEPVLDANVSLSEVGSARNLYSQARTDADGRYTLRALPGKFRIYFSSLPPSHVAAPGETSEEIEAADDAKLVEMATREVLPAAPPRSGEVRDEAGRPVAGVDVHAAWRTEIDGQATSGRLQTVADADGRFVLRGLGPAAAVTVTATFQDRKTQPPLETRSDDPEPLTLVMTPMPVFAMVGRLTAPAGKPLGGIPIGLEFREKPSPNMSPPLSFGSSAYTGQLRTKPDGSFETPREIERKPGEFRAVVRVSEFLLASSDWLPTPDGDLLRIPDLAITRVRALRVVAGRVVDREGAPIAGAAVSQAGDRSTWTIVRTGADGRFRLSGVPEGAALVFAEAEGFRFGGAVVGGDAPVEIRLARENAPPLAMRTPLPPLDRAEERATALEYLQPLAPKAISPKSGIDSNAVTLALARLSPERILDRIEERVIPPDDAVMVQVILGQFENDPESAFATIRENLSPASRATEWLALERYRPAVDQAQREEFLENALADARQVEELSSRIRLLGRIADRWLERGALEQARPILIEGRDALAEAPADRWFHEAEEFAEPLAVVDLPAAIALFERRGRTNVNSTDPNTLNRRKIGAAVRIARFQPDEAEALLPPPSPQFYDRPAAVLAIARRMAHVDLAHARRLLESTPQGSGLGVSVPDGFLPFSLGVLADELAEADPAQARTLLDEAFIRLRKIAVDHPGGQGPSSVASLMAELLPVVERVDPDRLDERIWLTAASRSSPRWGQDASHFQESSAIAAQVSRYHREVADALAAPVLEQFFPIIKEATFHPLRSVDRNLAVYDPQAVQRLIQSLPDWARQPQEGGGFGQPLASLEDQLRLAVAQILALPPEARPLEIGPLRSWRWPNFPGE